MTEHHPISPPPIEATELEDFKASLRAWYTDYYFGICYDYNKLAKKYGEPERPYPTEESFITEMMFELDRAKELKTYEHCGDCTAVPASCGRCMAEELYEVPSSVTWTGKAEGRRLYHEYLNNNKK